MTWELDGHEVSEVPAIPPQDYTGTISAWIFSLTVRGYNGQNYADLRIPVDVYDSVLEECE